MLQNPRINHTFSASAQMLFSPILLLKFFPLQFFKRDLFSSTLVLKHACYQEEEDVVLVFVNEDKFDLVLLLDLFCCKCGTKREIAFIYCYIIGTDARCCFKF